jgi:ADP-ribosyl-[dinitrogen reductase] hydrolase
MQIETSNLTKSLLLGFAVGDAMGVPYEFMQHGELIGESFDEMKGYGSHNQPAGSFSDDSSLTFCLVESLTKSLTLEETVKLFLRWYDEGYWTANGETFDIGGATCVAIENFREGIPLDNIAMKDEKSCGNGAMMRLLPLAFYFDGKSFDEKFELIQKYGALTHGHIRSHMASLIIVELAYQIIKLKKNNQSFPVTSNALKHKFVLQITHELMLYFKSKPLFQGEIEKFEVLLNSLSSTKIEFFKNSGYVMDTLTCVLQVLIFSKSYEEDIKLALHIGGDTDTNTAILGGLSGLIYGEETIPKKWLSKLLRYKDIVMLSDDWSETLSFFI